MFHQFYFSNKLRKFCFFNDYVLALREQFLLGRVDQKVHPILHLLKIRRKK